MEDSVCLRCKWYKHYSENPDAENGPGCIDYDECECGYDERNFGSPGGCMDWEARK